MDDVAKGIADFPVWHYEFELGEHRTPIFDADHRNRHLQRRDYLFGALLRVLGGSLAGLRVLDLGCNAGWWSLAALDGGAEFVLGIDGRQEYVDQANFVFETKGIDPRSFEFVSGDLFELDLSNYGRFDVVLCLGLFMHISRPVSLMELIEGSGATTLLIDTSITRVPGPFLRIHRQSVDAITTHAVDRELGILPSKRAIDVLGREFGFRTAVLRPKFSDWTGATDYRRGFRRGFICSKGTDPAVPGLDVEPTTRVSLLRDGIGWLIGGLRSGGRG